MVDQRSIPLRDQDVLVTIRCHLEMSIAGWFDFTHCDVFKGERGFSVPDGTVVSIEKAPPLPDPKWQEGDLIRAMRISKSEEDQAWEYYEYEGKTTALWRRLSTGTYLVRDSLHSIVPIARYGRPWTEDDG